MAQGERGPEWFFPSSRLLCAFSGNPLSSSLAHAVCFWFNKRSSWVALLVTEICLDAPSEMPTVERCQTWRLSACLFFHCCCCQACFLFSAERCLMKSQSTCNLWSPVSVTPLFTPKKGWPLLGLFFVLSSSDPVGSFLVSLGSSSRHQPGWFGPHLAMSRHLFIIPTGIWVLLVSSGWRPGLLSNILQCPGQLLALTLTSPPPKRKTYPAPNVSVEKPQEHIYLYLCIPFPFFLPHTNANVLYWLFSFSLNRWAFHITT